MQKLMQTLGGIAWLLTLLCGAANGQMVTVRVHSSVCSDGTCFGVAGYGTGVVVATEGNTSLVLTAAHNFDLTDRHGYPTRNGQINAVRIAGTARGELLRRWRDDTMDLAVVRAYGSFPAVPMATTPPRAGDTVTINGYDFADTSRPELRQTVCEVLDANPGDRAHTSRSWPVGTSGGGVFDRGGNLVGIAVTSNGFIVNRNFRQVVLSLARRAEFPPPNVTASADAGQAAAAESGPSSQGETQDASTHPSASEIQRYRRDDSAKSSGDTVQADPARPEAATRPSAASETGSMPGGRSSLQETLQPTQQADAADRLEQAKEGADKAVDLVDAIVSNPFVSTAIVGATGGTGAAGLAAWQMLMTYRRKRKQTQVVADIGQPTDSQQALIDRLQSTVGSMAARLETMQSQNVEQTQGGSGDAPDRFPPLHERDLDEVQQLVRLRELEGRNPLLDSFVGMSFEDEVNNLIDDPDAPDDQKQYARALRDIVRQRVDAAAPLSTGKSVS